MSVVITIYRGNSFLMTDPWGEISGQAIHGFFHRGLRFLSRYELFINGRETFLLTSRAVGDATAVYHLTNQVDGLEETSVGLVLTRRVAMGLEDRIVVRSFSPRPLEVNLTLLLDADFADMYRVKGFLWQERRGPGAPYAVRREASREGHWLAWRCRPLRGGPHCATLVRFDKPFDLVPFGLLFSLRLGPRGEWATTMVLEPQALWPTAPPSGLGREEPRRARPGTPPATPAPTLTGDWDLLRHAHGGALRDLDLLRRAATDASGDPHLLAAGIPWFVYLFGRDSLITSYQALPFFPEVAVAALRALAHYQARGSDPRRDMEPGKIPHQLPFGGDFQREIFPFPYYGSVDATPLYLVLLSETWRWTGDDALVRELKETALRALRWIDGSTGERGYLEYERRAGRGLRTQGWKDSADAIVFADGRIAAPPVRLVEAQGYVYDAKRRVAELAEEVWHEGALARQLEGEAAELRRRFNRDFWIPRRGGMYALALDGDYRPVDALASNVGHALWSGIVDGEKAGRCAELLLSPPLFSGWGLRTLASDEEGYHPVKYHRGTVWPWDSAIAAAGLRRYGFRREALRLAVALVDLAPYFDFSLPELIAGYGREEWGSPVEYPTACRPQAWSAGSVLLAVRLFLGLEPDPGGKGIAADPLLPEGVERLEVGGLRARGRRLRVAAGGDGVAVAAVDP